MDFLQEVISCVFNCKNDILSQLPLIKMMLKTLRTFILCQLYCIVEAIFISGFESTISTLDKSGTEEWPCFKHMLKFSKVSFFSFNIVIKRQNPPYQPGNMIRFCDHENTQGIARRPEISVIVLRAAGREPIFKLDTSLIGLASKK